jgi:DNA-binding MarR family transcriptional regulator
MTNRVDRLEEAGLVSRHADPDDRRSVLVRLTTAGADRVDACLSELLAQEHRLLGSLPDADRAQLAGLLRRLLVPFDGAVA